MQPGQNPFDPGRPFADGNSAGQRDSAGQPLSPPPPPPSYQQHFQNVRLGSASTEQSNQTAGQVSFQQTNTIFGGGGGSPSRPTTTSSSMPVFGGFGNPTTTTSAPALTTIGPFGQAQASNFGSTSSTSQPVGLLPQFNINPTGTDAIRSTPKMFTTANFHSVPSIFPGGASSASQFKFVANRSGGTRPTGITTLAPSKNVFEKRFSSGTSSTNIFGNVKTAGFGLQKLSSELNADKRRPVVQQSTMADRIRSAPTSSAKISSKVSVVGNQSRSRSKTNVDHHQAGTSKKTDSRSSGLSREAGRHHVQHSLEGSSGSLSRRSRLPSKDVERHNETRTRRLSERSGGSSGGGGELLRLPDDVEIGELKSIVLKGVPQRLNNKRKLLQHFGKYGIVQKVNCMVRKEMAIVHFTDHEGARKAKENGTEIEPGKSRVLILWGRMATQAARPLRSPTHSKTAETSKERNLPSATTPRKSDRKLEDDVRAELHAMRQGDDLDVPIVLSRPRVDAESSATFLSPKATKAKPPRRSSPHPPLSGPLQDGSDTIQALASRQSVTAGDKFQVLVARDKYLRQSTKKPSDLASARAVIGTCPDMCPEKERFMREERSQLHPYEVLVGSDDQRSGEFPRVDHRKAIKEYSRSSADQEEPLPHELRPPSVLARTMDYLVCNVLDLLDTVEGVNAAAEWYDFVWNRTRGIRKDITQQHLCDQTSVQLVEKCTRFHIHCAERLCEEDMSIFDQKINNENLTKCLQTLKHFYVDLEVKNERCPNECEFRAYDILLNLNEGDTLREVLCLRPDIRESNEVRFALRLFDNLNSNNYVAFFKNVRRAPYLTACILQRYFTQVRERALKVILKAYCPPNHSGQFPINKLVQMLAFENQTEAEEFLNYHSLSVELDYLVWDRAGLSYPESAVPTRRACSLIESKRCCSVGEVVNGGQLPANPLDTYQPHTSFDQQGNLINLLDVLSGGGASQESVITVEPSVMTMSTAVLDAPEQASVNFDEQKRHFFILQLNKAIEDEANDIAVDVLTAMTASVCRSSFEEIHFNFSVMTVASHLLTEVKIEIMRAVASETLREFKSLELRLRKQREEAELERQHLAKVAAAEKALDDVLNEVVSRETHRLASNLLREERDHEWSRRAQQCSETLSSEYFGQFIAQFIADIGVEVHSLETQYRKATLTRISKKLDKWRAVVFYHKWRKLVSKRKRTRHSMETFPSSVNMGQARCGSMAEPWVHGRLQSPLQIASDQTHNKCLLDLAVHRKHLESRLKDTPLDLLSLAENFLYRERAGSVTARGTYWKIAVLIANGRTDDDIMFSKWIRQKMGESHSSASFTFSSSAVELLNRKSSVFRGRAFGICTKAFFGSFDSRRLRASLKAGRELQGTRGVVMALSAPSSNASASSESYWGAEYRRLYTIITCMPRQPSAPVLLLCPWRVQSNTVEDGLHLKSLLNRRLISAYRIVEIDGDLREQLATNELCDCMEWLARMCPPVPDLKLTDVNAFVNDCIKKYFSSVVYQVIRNNARDCSVHFHPPPDLLVVGFNHAISFAARMVSSRSLKDVSWPPIEFSSEFLDTLQVNWNTDENLSAVCHLVERHRLPQFPQEIMVCTTFDQIMRVVWSYVDLAIPATDAAKTRRSKAVVTTRIQRILDRSAEVYDLEGCGLRPSDVVPWIDVIHAIIDHVFCCLAEVNMTVVYDSKMTETYSVCQEWMSAVDQALTAAENAYMKGTVLRQSSESDQIRTASIRREVKEEQGLKRKLPDDPFAEMPREKEVYMECQRLSCQLATEKHMNAQFDAYLERLLNGDKLLCLDDQGATKSLPWN